MGKHSAIFLREAPGCSRLLAGCLPDAARYGELFSRDAEVELSEWYVPREAVLLSPWA